jgi:hypothetical protein
MAQIDIKMSPQTVEALSAGGYTLYAFKAMQTALAGAAPLVWHRTQSFTTTTTLAWQETYQAFISHTPIDPGQVIAQHAVLDVRLGRAISIANDGALSVSGGGTGGGVDIFNYAIQPWDVGLSQVVGGALGPMFVLPVYPEQMQTVEPIERVLLMITGQPMEPGEVVKQAVAPGLFIDFTGGEAQQTVAFDINQGWTWGGGTWAQVVNPGADIQALLVQQ